MTESDIKIISKEEYQDNEYTEQKIIFDNNMFEQIKGKELDLSIDKILEVFLGIQIDKNGIKMQTHIVQKISNSEELLDTKKKLQSFLGLVNQVREYIPKLAENLKPLQKKLKKDIEYHFDEQDKKYIRKIKIMCKDLPKL